MGQAVATRYGRLDQATAARYGRYAGLLIFILGPILNVMLNGAQVLGSFSFWFGLYGWLAAAIVGGYLVYLALAAFVAQDAAPEVATAPAIAAAPAGTQVEAGELPAWQVVDLPAPPRFTL